MPAFGIAAMLAHNNQQLAVVVTQQAQHHEAVMHRFEALEASHARLPLQLRNAAASLEAPVLYPHGTHSYSLHSLRNPGRRSP